MVQTCGGTLGDMERSSRDVLLARCEERALEAEERSECGSSWYLLFSCKCVNICCWAESPLPQSADSADFLFEPWPSCSPYMYVLHGCKVSS